MITLEECKKALEKAEQRMFEHECGNDMYYSSSQYREDKEDIQYWKKQIEKFAKLKNWKKFRASIKRDIDNVENSL